MTRRVASGSIRSAAISATWCGSGGAPTAAGCRARSGARRATRRRRQRLTPIRYAVVRIQASGRSSSRRRWSQARTNASCTQSAASPRSPSITESCPTSRWKDAA